MRSVVKILFWSGILVFVEKATPMATAAINEGIERLDQEMKSSNDSSSESSGPPDSHEAMNNREIHSKVREKRSYEFLMGLINNNSRYEVTRVDPELTTQKPKIVSEGVNASELLLELMVKIASHPDQWDRVHKLLQTIDQDLKTSRDVVTKLRSLSNESDSNTINDFNGGNKTKYFNSTTEETVDNRTFKRDEAPSTEKQWPVFDLDEKHVQFINTNNANKTVQNASEKLKNKSSKPAYPKNFTYHRVTGKPDNTSKNPRAYIAVSVIAPKSTKQREKDEEEALENELHQLRPWRQNTYYRPNRFQNHEDTKNLDKS